MVDPLFVAKKYWASDIFIAAFSEVEISKERQMKGKRPTTIAEYIESASSQSQSHLRKIYSILKGGADQGRVFFACLIALFYPMTFE